MLNNTWKIPVGDWSNDGHGKCDWFIIKSNFTVEQAREAYFKAVKESGIDITEEIACEYQDSTVSKKILDSLPIFIQDLSADNLIETWDWEDDSLYHVISTDAMTIIILRFIKRYTPEFEYKIMDDIPMLPFCGFDSKNRHIGFIGYGLFD